MAAIETELTNSFETHPDAKIILSHPRHGLVLGARVLAEFGDDPTRYDDANYSTQVLRRDRLDHQGLRHPQGRAGRVARNHRFADACYLWAFAALGASPGARALYDAPPRAKGETQHQALRALANRLVGTLLGCLRNQTNYDAGKAQGGAEGK